MKAEAIPGNTQWVGAPAEPFVPALAADKQEGRAAA
jgi:hypothetical protein